MLCRVTMEGMTNLTNGTVNPIGVSTGNGNTINGMPVNAQQTNGIGPVVGVVTNNVDNGSQNGSTGSGRSTPSSSDSSPGKLFVGGLSWQTTPDKLRDYFGQFGTVTDVLVMKDPVTQVNNHFFSPKKAKIGKYLLFLLTKLDGARRKEIIGKQLLDRLRK